MFKLDRLPLRVCSNGGRYDLRQVGEPGWGLSRCTARLYTRRGRNTRLCDAATTSAHLRIQITCHWRDVAVRRRHILTVSFSLGQRWEYTPGTGLRKSGTPGYVCAVACLALSKWAPPPVRWANKTEPEGIIRRGRPSHPGLHSFPNLEYSVTGLCSSPLMPRVTKRCSFGNACKICFSMAKRR